MTDTQSQIAMRIRIPCSPSEVAALFGISLRLARAYLYQLKRQGRAHRTDKRIPKANPLGRQWEYLWTA
jgi:DNA-binding CsgD family transcriptional regulator